MGNTFTFIDDDDEFEYTLITDEIRINIYDDFEDGVVTMTEIAANAQ